MVRILHNVFELIADTINRMVGFLYGFFQSYLESPYVLVSTIMGLVFCCYLQVFYFLLKASKKYGGFVLFFP